MNNIQNFVIYLKKSVKAVARKTDWNTIRGAFTYYSSWQKYLWTPGAVVQPIPWFSFNAISFLKKLLKPEMVVYEYGSGGSTLFWSNHVRMVISIEHESEWHNKMIIDFESNNLKNVEYHLIAPEADPDFNQKSVSNHEHYISNDNRFTNRKFESYARQIDLYPDDFFDIVVVDGRARPSCIAHGVNKIKPGGLLILDNSEREYYLPSLERFTQNWSRLDFLGPVPYSFDFSQTTILKKPY